VVSPVPGVTVTLVMLAGTPSDCLSRAINQSERRLARRRETEHVSRPRVTKNISCLGKRCSHLRLGDTDVSVAYNAVRIQILAEVGGRDCLGYLRLD
jgi:hypothetical protein